MAADWRGRVPTPIHHWPTLDSTDAGAGEAVVLLKDFPEDAERSGFQAGRPHFRTSA